MCSVRNCWLQLKIAHIFGILEAFVQFLVLYFPDSDCAQPKYKGQFCEYMPGNSIISVVFLSLYNY